LPILLGARQQAKDAGFLMRPATLLDGAIEVIARRWRFNSTLEDCWPISAELVYFAKGGPNWHLRVKRFKRGVTTRTKPSTDSHARPQAAGLKTDEIISVINKSLINPNY
jgi:hypothetical protein